MSRFYRVAMELSPRELKLKGGSRWYWPWIVGRNGAIDIDAIILEASDTDGISTGASITAISKSKGNIVNGGLFRINLGDMDDLCRRWLEARGYAVQTILHGEEDEDEEV